jgi:hypothetical protein
VSKAVPGALFDDEFMSPSALMILEPMPTLSTLVTQVHGEGWPLAVSAQVMGAVAAGLILVQVLILLLEGDLWWKPLAIVALCGLEWLIGSLYLYALAEFSVRRGRGAEARAAVERLLTAHPDNPAARELAALVDRGRPAAGR